MSHKRTASPLDHQGKVARRDDYFGGLQDEELLDYGDEPLEELPPRYPPQAPEVEVPSTNLEDTVAETQLGPHAHDDAEDEAELPPEGLRRGHQDPDEASDGPRSPPRIPHEDEEMPLAGEDEADSDEPNSDQGSLPPAAAAPAAPDSDDPFADPADPPDPDAPLADPDAPDADGFIPDRTLRHAAPMREDARDPPTRETRDAFAAATQDMTAAEMKEVLQFLHRKRQNEEEHRAWAATHADVPKADILARWAPRFDHVWTPADEDAVLAEAEAHPYYAYLGGSFQLPKRDNVWAPMWRRLLCLCQVPPTDIVGARTFMECAEPWRRAGDGRAYAQYAWPQPFSAKLRDLVLAIPEPDGGLAAVFIKWAAACRLNDRRRIPLLVPGDHRDVFLEMVSDALAQTDGRKSVARIHQEKRDVFAQGGYHLPWYSRVLHNIEQQAFDRAAPPQHAGLDVGRAFERFAPYQIETRDLTVVLRALDSVRHRGVAMLTPAADVAKAVGKVSKYQQAPYPKTRADFQECLQKAFVADQRWLARRRKQAALDPDVPMDDAEEEPQEEEEPQQDDGFVHDGLMHDAALPLPRSPPPALLAPPPPRPATPELRPLMWAPPRYTRYPEQHVHVANLRQMTNRQRPVAPGVEVREPTQMAAYPGAESLFNMREQLDRHLPHMPYLALPRGLREPDNLCYERTVTEPGNRRHNQTATYLSESLANRRRR